MALAIFFSEIFFCIICNSNGENIGFINLIRWMGGGEAVSWSYYVDKNMQGKGYGRKAAELAVEILQSVADGKMIKVATEQSNEKAQRLYVSLGLHKLDELDGDDFVFGRLLSDSRRKCNENHI